VKLTYTQVILHGPPASSTPSYLKEQRGGCWEYSLRHLHYGVNTDGRPEDRAIPAWVNGDLGFRLFKGVR
jgi:hypothetical protein